MFHEFDTTNDGEIDIQEFKGALQVLGMKLGADKARKLFGAFDKDNNNTVDFVEFCHVIFPDIDEVRDRVRARVRVRVRPKP